VPVGPPGNDFSFDSIADEATCRRLAAPTFGVCPVMAAYLICYSGDVTRPSAYRRYAR
jgi:hypothetical protein